MLAGRSPTLDARRKKPNADHLSRRPSLPSAATAPRPRGCGVRRERHARLYVWLLPSWPPSRCRGLRLAPLFWRLPWGCRLRHPLLRRNRRWTALGLDRIWVAAQTRCAHRALLTRDAVLAEDQAPSLRARHCLACPLRLKARSRADAPPSPSPCAHADPHSASQRWREVRHRDLRG